MTRSGIPRCSRRTGNACCAATSRGPSSSVAGAGAAATAVDGAFHRRRDADRGVSRPQELQAKGAPRSPPPDDPGNPTVNFHGERWLFTFAAPVYNLVRIRDVLA